MVKRHWKTLVALSFLIYSGTLGCASKPVVSNPTPSPTPAATATPSPTPIAGLCFSGTTQIPCPSPTPEAPKVYYTLGTIGTNVDKKFAQQAIDIMNENVRNGCLHEKFMKRTLTSLKNVEGPVITDKEAAFQAYLANAPYALDLRWYRPTLPSNVIGYTYNWLDGMDQDKCYNQPSPVCPTETKIYSNTRIISGYTAGDYGAHLTHESSHQGRARGFVHWTVFDGSFPYEIGYAMDDCVNQPTGKSLAQEQRAPSRFKKTMIEHMKHEKEVLESIKKRKKK